MTALSDAIPAATLILVRDRDGAAPDLLMVERAAHLVFAGGALVFPGGRVEHGDGVPAAAVDGEPDDMAARIAAVRETIEEAGVAAGVTGLSSSAIDNVRDRLHAGVPLRQALAEAGAALDLNQLVPFARWCPAHHETRRFDTRFYLARLPAHAAPAVVDGTEHTRLLWTSAATALADADAGRVRLIFPTRRVLERLALFSTFADAAKDASRWPQRIVTPWTEDRDGVSHLCIPADLGYPVDAEPLDQTARG